jgi:hypothetical protein
LFNVPELGGGRSHPVADKRIEHSTQSRDSGFRPSSTRLCLMRGIEGGGGHGGILSNPSR